MDKEWRIFMMSLDVFVIGKKNLQPSWKECGKMVEESLNGKQDRKKTRKKVEKMECKSEQRGKLAKESRPDKKENTRKK